MVFLSFLGLAFAALPLAAGINISVTSDGGNATSGHQYGFLHEVRAAVIYMARLLQTV